MKAVILAAGKSTRAYPLTLDKPKALLRIANKALIEHNLGQLTDIVDEVIIVIGYKGKMLRDYLGDKFGDMKLSYVEQKQQLGTGHALMQAKEFLGKERFIVIMGDDLYFRGDMRRCLRYKLAVMAKRVENYWDFGVFIKKGEKLLDIIEKPKEFVSDLANTAFYIFDNKIFDCLKKVQKSSRNEYELTAGLKQLAKDEEVFCVQARVWLPIGYPWNLLEADQIVRDNDVLVGENSKINGKVSNSSIGKNCRINGFVKNSIIGDNVTIHKDSLVEDSVIGDNVEFGGTVKTADMVEIKVKGKSVEVENFGAAIGDNSKLTDVLVQPGALVWSGCKIKGRELKGIVRR